MRAGTTRHLRPTVVGPAAAVTLALALLAGCGSSDDPTLGAAVPPSADTTVTDVAGAGRLTLAGDDLRFDVDTCYEGDGLPHSPTLLLHVEGAGADATGRAFQVQLVRTLSQHDEHIDVIRLNYGPDERPPEQWLEAQRVHDTRSGDVHGLWGDETAPLFDLSREDATLTVVARGAVFGSYASEPGREIVGQGDLQVSCTVTTA